jgi:Fe-S cluster assembly protein SufD
MSLARAIETGDLAELPSRRDEDWRWTDLKGLLRVLPASAPAEVAAAPIEVAAGEIRVVRLDFVAGDGAQVARRRIRVAGSLVLIENHQTAGVSETDLDIILEAGARLERVVIATAAEDAVQVVIAQVALAEGARFAQTIVTAGARRQRLETRVRHPGGGAEARLDGLYVVAGKRHADLTTAVIHEGPGGTTNQLTKGVVTDQGRGVFQGRIEVRPGADGTDAKMGHHALVLGDRAEVDAKPELEIWADDVVCSHGNTVGALDEEALFYARQRGIPEPEARAMLTEAFLGEVVARIEHEEAREAVAAFVAGRLA